MSSPGDTDEDPDETNRTGTGRRDPLEELMALFASLPAIPTPEAREGVVSLPSTLNFLPLLEKLFQSISSIPGTVTLQRDESHDRAGMFLPCVNESESEMLETRLTQWSAQLPQEHSPLTFPQALANELSRFLKEEYKKLVRKPQCSLSHEPVALQGGNYDGVLGSLMKLLQNPSVQSLVTSMNSSLTEIFRQARNNNSGISKVPQPSDTNCKSILDLSAVHGKYLNFLLQLFTQNQHTRESLQRLVQYVPTRTVQSHMSPECTTSPYCTKCNQPVLIDTQACFECGKVFCTHCPMEKTKVPSFGHTRPVPACLECFERYSEQEKNEWMERSMQLLAGETEEDIQAAFGCFLMALHANQYSSHVATRQVNKFAKLLIEQECSELALPLLSATSLQSELPAQSVHAHLLASKALESMAYNPNILPGEQILLLKAAKAECDAASEMCSTSTTVEIPDMSTQIASLEKTVTVIESEDRRQFSRAKQLAFNKLERAWNTKNWDEIFKMMAATADDHLIRTDHRNPTMEAIKDIVEKKKGETFPQSKTIIFLLTGFVDVFQRKISEGIASIELAVWNGLSNSALFYKTAVDIVVGTMIYNPEFVQPLHVLQSACQILADEGSLDPTKVLPSLHLKEENLMPPFQLQWPHTMFLLHDFAIMQYEDNVKKQIAQNKWTTKEAAKAYLDLITRCNHPVEIVLCYLNASLWLLKSLQEKADNESAASPSNSPLKMAVLHYLTQAFIITRSCLHPGMQLYVSRIAVGASLVATKLAGIQATPNDAERIVQFLYSFVHSARLCPFWNSPIVLVSEAHILKKMTGKQHSAFVSALQYIPEEFCHLKPAELMYQIYENDLTSLQKSTNPEEMKYQAMQELLKEKQLTSQDISSLMMSSLNLRCSEGWIDVQQPATMNLDYSEIKGLKVHLGGASVLDEPSLDLLVISSDGKNGIVSQSDVDTFLTLDPENIMPLYFSLDPPSRNEKYHPFQQLRFHPNDIRNTAVLQTLFEADYIMKFFSIGSEASSIPPFRQKPCIESLLSKLPPHLKEALKPVHQRGKLRGNMFRFWIEAKELQYDVQTTGNVVTLKCGDPEMIIRNHRIYFAPDGKVRDTEDDSDPDSPQALFAADLTKHYDEIGRYFPAFARIKELCKLQMLANYVKNNVVKFESGFLKSWAFKCMVTDVESNAKTSLTLASGNNTYKHTLPCLWVPAAVYKDEDEHHMHLSYGGVNLAPHYVKVTLAPLPYNTQAIPLKRRHAQLAAVTPVPFQTTSYGSSNTRITAAPSQKYMTDSHDDDDSSSTSSSGGFERYRSLWPTTMPLASGPSGRRSQKQSSHDLRSKHHTDTSTLSATGIPNPYQHDSSVAQSPQAPYYNAVPQHHANTQPPALKAKLGTTSMASGSKRQPHLFHPSQPPTATGSKSQPRSRTGLQPFSTAASAPKPHSTVSKTQPQYKQSTSSTPAFNGSKPKPRPHNRHTTATRGSGSVLQPQTSQTSGNSYVTGSKQPSRSKATAAATASGCKPPIKYGQVLVTSDPEVPTRVTAQPMISKERLPITKALLSTLLPNATEVFRLSNLSHMLKHLLSAVANFLPKVMECSTTSAVYGVATHTLRHLTGQSGEKTGNGGRDSLLNILKGAVATLLEFLTKTSQLRHRYRQQKYRKEMGCTDRHIHVAHTFSLELFLYIFKLANPDCLIEESFLSQLRDKLNVEANFELVSRHVNLVDHKRYDAALINCDYEGLSQDKERGGKIIRFFEEHLAPILPPRLLQQCLSFFCERQLMNEHERDAIENSEREVVSQPNPSSQLTITPPTKLEEPSQQTVKKPPPTQLQGSSCPSHAQVKQCDKGHTLS